MVTERQKVNFLSLLATLGVLLLAAELSSGSFATRINKISENLDRALSRVMDDRTPQFTNLTDDAVYVSDSSFNAKGMAGLYNITSSFIDTVFPKSLSPANFIKIGNNNDIQLVDYQSEWQSLLARYAGLLTVIILLVIIFVLMPLCGLCFCLCRCCGKCGARSQPFDKKHDLCKKITLATLLIALGTLLLFGVVCAFASNQQMQEGVQELTGNLRNGVTDVKTYLDSTNDQINTLLNTNYKEFEEVLLNTINDSVNIVYGQLEDYSNATAMTEVSNFVHTLPNITEGFESLKKSTNTLRVFASQLNDAVRKVKKDMLNVVTGPTCQSLPKCKDISEDINKLQTNIHFNNLPDISSQIEELNQFIGEDSGLLPAVQHGMEQLDNIKNTIGENVNKTLDEGRKKILEAGTAITSGTKNVTNIVNDLKEQIDGSTKPVLDTADEYIVKYSPYRYYVALAISCLLLLITLCIALGLICGICGKRPEGYGDDCCNKGAGSSFLICGVYFMFLTGFIIALVVLVTFLLGTVTQRVICDPLRDPKNSDMFRLVDQVNLSQAYITFPISTALEKCYANETLYEVFNLTNQFNIANISNYLNEFNITEILRSLDLDMNLDDFSILGDANMQTVEAFAHSNFADIEFDKFQEVLETNFTNANLNELADSLGKLIDEIKGASDTDHLVRQLQLNKMHLELYQEKIVEPMKLEATGIVSRSEQLKNDLKLNHESFNEAMTDLITEIKKAEKTIKEQGVAVLKNNTEIFANGIISQVQTYIDRVVNMTQTEVGRCGPLALVINATLTSTCDKILKPWNGYWFGLFWSVLVFIPAIIISVKLATLYQKHSTYSRELIETRHAAKKKHKKQKRYEDRPIPAAGGDMVVREYAASSNQDTRYSDMAPKQWEEFPAGGPPHYQRAPTEYERPPPYYYPGAGDNTQ